MRSSVDHGYAGIQNFKTLMKMNDCETYNRTNLKIIDNRNVVDIVISQRY